MPLPELKKGSCCCQSKRRVFPELKPPATARACCCCCCCCCRLLSRGLCKAGAPCTIESSKLSQASAFLLVAKCGLLATFLRGSPRSLVSLSHSTRSPSQETGTVSVLTQNTALG